MGASGLRHLHLVATMQSGEHAHPNGNIVCEARADIGITRHASRNRIVKSEKSQRGDRKEMVCVNAGNWSDDCG